jgi:2-keto-4-pentenoate hydratase
MREREAERIMDSDDILQFGGALAAARKNGNLADVPLNLIASIEEAEDVQEAAIGAYGGAIIGYSVQATSAITRRLLGCEGPIFGLLTDKDVYQGGDHLLLPRGVLGAGCVLSFTLARPFPNETEEISRETVRDAVVTCRLGLEILGRRVSGSTPLNDWTAIADFGLLLALVQGPRVVHWRDLDLASTQATLRVNGVPVLGGRGAEVLGNPLDAVVWLARSLKARGRELEAGEIVATGTCTGLLQVIPGQLCEADFGELGRVEAAFE